MSMLSRRLLIPALSFMIATSALAQAADPARAPVQSLSDGLVTIMKGGKQLGFQGRAGRIQPVVDRVFDLPLMTRLAVGPAWTTISAPDRAALTAAFRRMTTAQYAANFSDYSGQAIAIDPKVEARGGDRLVRTTLSQPKSASVSLAYRLRQSADGWRIIDVFYQNAISQLATRRADYASILSAGGAKALIAHLNQLADKAAR